MEGKWRAAFGVPAFALQFFCLLFGFVPSQPVLIFLLFNYVGQREEIDGTYWSICYRKPLKCSVQVPIKYLCVPIILLLIDYIVHFYNESIVTVTVTLNQITLQQDLFYSRESVVVLFVVYLFFQVVLGNQRAHSIYAIVSLLLK